MAGGPVEQYEFIRLIRRDQFIFVPLITLLLILTTFLIYRHIASVTLAMSVVFMTLVWTLGTMALLGIEINLVTSLLAPVIMIIAVVNSIHFINLFMEIRQRHKSVRDTICLTMQQLGRPCFLTHFTTILGFSSLMLNPVPAIQQFGLFSSLGTFYAYLIQMFLVPILLPILPYRPKKPGTDDGRFFNRVVVVFLEKLEFKWKRVIILLTILVLIVAWQGILKLKVDTNIAKQMKADSELAVATNFIDQNITGVYAMGFVFKSPEGKKLTDPEILRKLDSFQREIEGFPAVRKVNGISMIIKKVHEAVLGAPRGYEIPEKQETIEMYLTEMAKARPDDLFQWITPDFKEIRLEARIRAVGTQEGAELENRIFDLVRQRFGDSLSCELTGNMVLLGKMAKNLVKYQLRSFGVSFFSILFLIVIIFRSLKIGLLAAIPNLIPILTMYGLMGFIGIELSMPTAMISGIVLGMVVDASIHFLHRFRHEFRRRRHYIQALHHTLRNVGQALMTSTLILVAGFASGAFASFRPTIHFGILTSLTIFLALICTLVILPVCLVVVKPFGEHHLFARSKRK